MASDLVDVTEDLIEWVKNSYGAVYTTAPGDLIYPVIVSVDNRIDRIDWQVMIEILPVRRFTEELGSNALYTQVSILLILVQDIEGPILSTEEIRRRTKNNDSDYLRPDTFWDSKALLELLQVIIDAIPTASLSLGMRFSRDMQFSRIITDASILQYSLSVEFSYEP